jgi:hypothetical protein
MSDERPLWHCAQRVPSAVITLWLTLLMIVLAALESCTGLDEPVDREGSQRHWSSG